MTNRLQCNQPDSKQQLVVLGKVTMMATTTTMMMTTMTMTTLTDVFVDSACGCYFATTHKSPDELKADNELE
jgi:hypothetical protein